MLDAGEQHVVDIVAEHGWMVQKVFPKDNDPQEWFAYTIGLPITFGWPELICFGLDLDQMHRMLNNTVEECRDGKKLPRVGLILDTVLKGFDTKLVATGSWQNSYTGWAQWFANRSTVDPKPLECLQLVWPDKTGKFPDDPDCNDEVRSWQTPLELI